MSSLIFFTAPDRALIATDTLVVDETGAASAFTSKAMVVPHLRLVVAGTGIGGFSTKWMAHVNDNMVVSDIDHLDCHAPDCLRVAFDLEHAAYARLGVSTTIYHFGISRSTGKVHAYVYRSERGFKSERLPYGLRAKPECGDAGKDADGLQDAVIAMMQAQRRIQAMQPKAERLYIGGEIQVIEITEHGLFACYRLHAFEDFAQTEKEIYERFRPG